MENVKRYNEYGREHERGHLVAHTDYAALKVKLEIAQQLKVAIEDDANRTEAALKARCEELERVPGEDWRKFVHNFVRLLEIERDTLRDRVKELEEQLSAREDGVRGFTFEDAMRIVRGAIDVYGGGYSGEERKAFTAGIQTAFNCLENARPNDTQTAANLRIGSQALAALASTKED